MSLSMIQLIYFSLFYFSDTDDSILSTWPSSVKTSTDNFIHSSSIL